MKVRLIFLILLCLALISCFNYALSQEATTKWVDATLYREFNIVMPANSNPYIQQAVETFKKYWEKCAQKEISVSTVNEGKVNVWIGSDACSLEFMENIDRPELGTEGFLIFTYTPSRKYAEKGVGKHLVVCADDDIGAVHGVYSFFENVCGARWYAEDCVITPAFRISIPPQNFYYVPPFDIRVIYSNLPRFRLDYEMKQALHLRFDISETKWVDLSKIIERDSVICLSDSDTVAEVKNRIKNLISNDKQRELWIFRLTQDKKCECERCKQTLKETGSFITPYVNLFNEFLEDKENTSILEVKLIALSLSNEWCKPPTNIDVSNKLYIELDTESCNLARAMSDVNCKENVEFARYLQGWLRLTDNVYVRYRLGVCVRDPLFPLTDLVYLQQNLQWLDQKRVKGVIYHILGDKEWVYSDWDVLKRYIIAMLAWNPDLMLDGEFIRFLTNYYGKPAGEKLYEYIQYLFHYVRNKKETKCFYDSVEVWWDREFAEKYLGVVKSAMDLVKSNDTCRRRLLPILLSAYYAMFKSLSVEEEKSALQVKLQEEVIEILTQLESIYGVEAVNEYRKLFGI